MIARGTAALFAHLVHYRQLRFLWAISLTADERGMGLQGWGELWLPPPQHTSRCWAAFYPAIAISEQGWYGGVRSLLCFEHPEGLPATPEPWGMRLGRLCWLLVLLFHLVSPRWESIYLLAFPMCSPNAWASTAPSFAAAVEMSFNCYPQPILSNWQIDLQVRLNLYHTNPTKA